MINYRRLAVIVISAIITVFVGNYFASQISGEFTPIPNDTPLSLKVKPSFPSWQHAYPNSSFTNFLIDPSTTMNSGCPAFVPSSSITQGIEYNFPTLTNTRGTGVYYATTRNGEVTYELQCDVQAQTINTKTHYSELRTIPAAVLWGYIAYSGKQVPNANTKVVYALTWDNWTITKIEDIQDLNIRVPGDVTIYMDLVQSWSELGINSPSGLYLSSKSWNGIHFLLFPTGEVGIIATKEEARELSKNLIEVTHQFLENWEGLLSEDPDFTGWQVKLDSYMRIDNPQGYLDQNEMEKMHITSVYLPLISGQEYFNTQGSQPAMENATELSAYLVQLQDGTYAFIKLER